MPTLDWIGKKAVENHHRDVPFHLLEEVPELSCGDKESGNMLIQGDNLVALKALLPYYAGKVKCIYIDPPYNTGDESWIYNDNVNSKEIYKWLGKVVGKEAEDLSRHDKWLCMMYPRIKLLVSFLQDDGFLFVSLDDNELANFQLLMKEILPRAYITTLIWKSRRNLDNRSLHNVSVDHEYVVAYRIGNQGFRGAEKDKTKYSNPDNDPRGAWMSDNLVGLATKDRRPNLHYSLVNPETGIVYACPDKGWRYSKETMAQKILEGRIIWPKTKAGRPRHKKFMNELQSEFAGFSSFIECGNTNEGTEEVGQILGSEKFIFPKPRSLIEVLIEQVTVPGDIVLDSFSGTGTTAHAVLALNYKQEQKLKFICIEMDSHICENVTIERLKRVISGYSYANNNVTGIGGGFRYYRLGKPLFDESGKVYKGVTYSQFARHVFFIETGHSLENPHCFTPLIGTYNNTAIYLLFNGILKDKTPNGGNALTKKILAGLPPHEGPKVIYGTSCRLSPVTLRENNIVFKQIPYDIKVD